MVWMRPEDSFFNPINLQMTQKLFQMSLPKRNPKLRARYREKMRKMTKPLLCKIIHLSCTAIDCNNNKIYTKKASLQEDDFQF